MCHCFFLCGGGEHVCFCVRPSVAKFNSGSEQNGPQQDRCPPVTKCFSVYAPSTDSSLI